MSSCSVIYIEYRKSDKDEWKLLKSYMPLEDYKEVNSNPPYEDAVLNVGGSEFFISRVIEKYGIVRDFLNDPNKKFNNRGFPEDLSVELKSILDKQQEEILELNKNGDYNHDWRYGKSWCSLLELINGIEESYQNVYQYFVDSKFSEELERIYSMIDKIYDQLVPPDPNKDKEDRLQDNCVDELEDLQYAKSFCTFIESLVSFITGSYHIESNIRIVYYTE